MLKISGKSEKPCFVSGSREDCVDVKFTDGTFTGTLCKNVLFQKINEKSLEAENAKTPSPNTKKHADKES